MLHLLHLADLHLGWSAGFLGDKADEFSRRRDELLHRIREWANAPGQQIDLVLLVGDIFDSHRPEAALVESVLADLRSLVAAGKTVVTVPGNHDEITYHDSVYQRYRDRWPGLLITNPMPAAPVELSVAGQSVYIYSLAYTGGLTKVGTALQPLQRIKETGIHIGAFHGSLDFSGGDRDLPLQSDLLAAAGYDYVALGHWHNTRLLVKGKTTIAYAGAIAGKGFSDPGCGQLLLADVEPGRVATRLLPWEAPAFRLEQLDVADLEDTDQLDQLLQAWADPELSLRLELTGSAGWLLEPEAICGRHKHEFYHLEIVGDGLYLADELLDVWAREATMRGLFVRRLQGQLQTAEDPGTRRLLQLALRRGVAAFLAGGV